MAESHHAPETGSITQGVSWSTVDRDHQATYSGMLSVTKVAIVLIILLLIGMAIFLV